MYVQVARYLGHACIQQNTSQEIYICLGSKIPHGKKKEQKERARKEKEEKINNNNNNNNNNNKIKSCLAKKQHACKKR